MSFRSFAVLVTLAWVGTAAGRRLEGGSPHGRGASERQLLADAGVVLALDAASNEVGPGLISLENGRGDAVWSSPADPAMSVDLHNAGYDQAYGGAVVFTPPAQGSAEAGTYADGTPVGVQGGAWGDEFSALVWYKPSGLAPGANPVLLQVSGLDEQGDPRASATWRVAGFQDQTSGYIPIIGFDARPTFTADSLRDCWLAVVKSGPSLQFFRDGQAAGAATAAYVVNDYGADSVALGVDFSTLEQPGGNATDAADAAPSKPLGWLSGSLGGVEVHSRALAAADVAAKYGAQSQRFAESLCSQEVPAAGVSPTPAPLAGAPPSPGVPPGPSPAPATPTGPSPLPSNPAGPNPSPAKPAGPSPSPAQAPVEPPKPPSTLDTSTAMVAGSGSRGNVTNTLTLTGGGGLDNLGSDPAKQEQLKQAIVAALNLPPGYTTDNVQIKIVSITQQGARRRLQAASVKVVVQYTLTATPEVGVEVLQQAENNVYLFIRVQQSTIPWWSGPTATVCISDVEGACIPSKPPITPPVVNQDCSANVCFLLDGSKSLINVDAWNDVVAAARSIMYSISDPAAIFDVFYFSNDVYKIFGHATGAEVAANNSLISQVVNTVPIAHGTFMAQALQTCQGVLLEEDSQASRTIVLITDGRPTDPAQTFDAASAAKQSGIKLVVVGAGDIDYATLKALASGPQFLFANSNLDSSQLMLMADLASQGVCRELD